MAGPGPDNPRKQGFKGGTSIASQVGKPEEKANSQDFSRTGAYPKTQIPDVRSGSAPRGTSDNWQNPDVERTPGAKAEAPRKTTTEPKAVRNPK